MKTFRHVLKRIKGMMKVIFNILERLPTAAAPKGVRQIFASLSDNASSPPPLRRRGESEQSAIEGFVTLICPDEEKCLDTLSFGEGRGEAILQMRKIVVHPAAANCPLSLLTVCLLFFTASCTKEITVELPPPEKMIVVEGYIEQGQAPYVLLSRNSAFFGGIDVNDLEQYIVRGAVVTVSDITDANKILTDTLDEICIDTTIGDQSVTVCAYRSFNPTIIGELRKIYSLRVVVDSIVITAKTVIPDLLKLDSVWYEPHEDPENDTLVNVLAKYKDPDTLGNYFRYFSKRNSEAFYYVFVTDDRFFNGQDFELPLQRGEDPDAYFDQDTYGYFWRGDTVIIKWASIDKATYDFWNTLDYETNSGGPFGSATVIKTNIEGGLGIWGGYAAFYDTLYIPK